MNKPSSRPLRPTLLLVTTLLTLVIFPVADALAAQAAGGGSDKLAAARTAEAEALKRLRADFERMSVAIEELRTTPSSAEPLRQALAERLATLRDAILPKRGKVKERKFRKALDKHLDDAFGGLFEGLTLENAVPALRARYLERFEGLEEEALDAAARAEAPALSAELLTPWLDSQVPFTTLWNGHIYRGHPAATAYHEAAEARRQAELRIEAKSDPLLRHQIGAPRGYARVKRGTYMLVSKGGFAGNLARKRKVATRESLKKDALVGLFEVTHGEYSDWLDTLPREEAIRREPRDGDRKSLWTMIEALGRGRPTTSQLRLPVRGIRPVDAAAYAAAQGARLPTELEWVAAFTGPTKKARDVPQYPWGDWGPDRALTFEDARARPVEVGSFPAGRGPYGHYDLAGNVSEFVLTRSDGEVITLEDLLGEAQDFPDLIVRGGSFQDPASSATSDWVYVLKASDRSDTMGFRLARDL